MTYRIPLPEGSRLSTLDLIEPNSASVLRFIRRSGLAGYEPSTAAALLAACETSGQDLVMFDVGSNIGLYSHLAAAIFDPRAVVAFEPSSKTAATSRRIARRNGLAVHVIEAAVGEQSGMATLYISPISDSSNSLVEGFRDATESDRVPVMSIDEHVDATGLVPTLIKIDVETYEQQVLRGATATISEHRPIIIVEVLKRKGRDHGVELTEEMRDHGYHHYALSARPSWRAEAQIHGLGTTDRDWLLLPDPITPDFVAGWERWRHRLAEITADRNPRVPLTLSARAAFRRGGAREVVAAAIRFGRSSFRRRRVR